MKSQLLFKVDTETKDKTTLKVINATSENRDGLDTEIHQRKKLNMREWILSC